MAIKLKSAVYEVVAIKEKSKADMLKELNIGDTIQLSIEVEAVGGRECDTKIKVKNTLTGEMVGEELSSLPELLGVFDLRQV